MRQSSYSQHIGARVIKRDHPPATPMSRVLSHPVVKGEATLQLQRLHAQADPVTLLAEIRTA